MVVKQNKLFNFPVNFSNLKFSHLNSPSGNFLALNLPPSTSKLFPSNILKNFGLKSFGGKKDWDFDGVLNDKDCQPRNTMRQDFLFKGRRYPDISVKKETHHPKTRSFTYSNLMNKQVPKQEMKHAIAFLNTAEVVMPGINKRMADEKILFHTGEVVSSDLSLGSFTGKGGGGYLPTPESKTTKGILFQKNTQQLQPGFSDVKGDILTFAHETAHMKRDREMRRKGMEPFDMTKPGWQEVETVDKSIPGQTRYTRGGVALASHEKEAEQYSDRVNIKLKQKYKYPDEDIYDTYYENLENKKDLIGQNAYQDNDNDGVNNLMDCAPEDPNKHGGELFWKKLEEKDIYITAPRKQQKQIRKIYEKRPELLEQSRGVTVATISEKQMERQGAASSDAAYSRPREQIKEIGKRTFGTDYRGKGDFVALHRDIFRRQGTNPEQLLTHELQHRTDYYRDPELFDKGMETYKEREEEIRDTSMYHMNKELERHGTNPLELYDRLDKGEKPTEEEKRILKKYNLIKFQLHKEMPEERGPVYAEYSLPERKRFTPLTKISEGYQAMFADKDNDGTIAFADNSDDDYPEDVKVINSDEESKNATTRGAHYSKPKVKMVSIFDIKQTWEEFPEGPSSEETVSGMREHLLKGGKLPPILIDKGKELIDGRHRLQLYKRLGYKEVPTIEGETPFAEDITIDGKKLNVKRGIAKGQPYAYIIEDEESKNKLTRLPSTIEEERAYNIQRAKRRRPENIMNTTFTIPMEQAWGMRAKHASPGDMSPVREDYTMNIIRARTKAEGFLPIRATQTDLDRGILQDGKHRLIVAKALGYKDIPIQLVEDKESKNMAAIYYMSPRNTLGNQLFNKYGNKYFTADEAKDFEYENRPPGTHGSYVRQDTYMKLQELQKQGSGLIQEPYNPNNPAHSEINRERLSGGHLVYKFLDQRQSEDISKREWAQIIKKAPRMAPRHPETTRSQWDKAITARPRLILKNPSPTKPQWERALLRDPTLIKKHPSPTRTQWTQAIKRKPEVIISHPSPTEQQLEMALIQKPSLVKRYPLTTIKQWDSIVKKTPHMIEKHPAPSKELWDEVIKQDSTLITKHPSPTEQQWDEAVFKQPVYITSHPSPTEQQWDNAIEKYPSLIIEHPSPTEQQWDEAIVKNVDLIKHRPSATNQQWDNAVKRVPYLITDHPSPSKELWREIGKKNIKYIKHYKLGDKKEFIEQEIEPTLKQQIGEEKPSSIPDHFSNHHLFNLAYFVKQNQDGIVHKQDIERSNLIRLPIVKQFMQQHPSKTVSYNDIVQFDRQTDNDTSLIDDPEKTKVNYSTYSGGFGLERISDKPNVVFQYNLDKNRIPEFSEQYDADDSKVFQYIKQSEHPTSLNQDLTLGMIRLNPLDKETLFVEEIQSDLPKHVLGRETTEFEDRTFKRFNNEIMTKYPEVKKIIVPTTDYKKDKYRSGGSLHNVYDTIPKKYRYKKMEDEDRDELFREHPELESDEDLWVRDIEKDREGKNKMVKFIDKHSPIELSKEAINILYREKTKPQQTTQFMFPDISNLKFTEEHPKEEIRMNKDEIDSMLTEMKQVTTEMTPEQIIERNRLEKQAFESMSDDEKLTLINQQMELMRQATPEQKQKIMRIGIASSQKVSEKEQQDKEEREKQFQYFSQIRGKFKIAVKERLQKNEKED